MEIFSGYLRDFKHTFNSETQRPWAGVWSATNFYEKYHILIAVVTDEHLGEINESNVTELYRISLMCHDRIGLKKFKCI